MCTSNNRQNAHQAEARCAFCLIASLLDYRLTAQAGPPVDELRAEQHERHGARREERTERDVLAPAPPAERDQHDADHRAVQEPGEQPAEHIAPAEPPEEHPEDEREPDVAEAHAARGDEMQDEEE